MARTFTQIPPDSTGDKLDMRAYTAGSDVVHSQGVHYGGLPSFRLLCESGAPAANKYHIYLGNNSGSAQTIWLTGLYALNLQTAAVTGVINRFNFRRVTGAPTLTAVAPLRYDSSDPALAGVTAGHTVTAGLTDGPILLPLILSSEEQTAVSANTGQHLHHLNLLPPLHPFMRPLALRPAEGVAVRQLDAGAVGSFAWIIDFSIEADT